MITRISKCSDVVFGNGTVSIGKDTTGFIECIYNKPKTPVGEEYNKDCGKDTTKLDVECVCLRFDKGKDALLALDILLEDLAEIKAKLLLEVSNEQT